MTKRYYVTEKASQISKELEELAKKQEILSELKLGQDFTGKEQQKLNEEFDYLEKEIRGLEKDNQGLRKPIQLDTDKEKTDAVKQDQQDALEEINKHQGMDESSQSEEKQKQKTTPPKNRNLLRQKCGK